MAVGRSGATCSAAFEGRQTACGGDGRKPIPRRANAVRRRQPTAGRERWKPERGETHSGSMPRTTARPGDAGRRKDHSGRNAKLPKCEASGICRLMSADSPCQRWRTPTAIERSRSDRRRRAPRRNGWARGGLTWPRSAVLCAFGVEGALRPLADSAGQALSRFMPSASIHKARLIFTFWSMP